MGRDGPTVNTRSLFWLALSKVFFPPTILFTALAIGAANAMDYFEDRSKSSRSNAPAD
jgi:hypothetical protein